MSNHNGLITTIWGNCAWEFLHNVSFGYPDNPSEEDKQNYYNFFTSLQYVLPCSYCREHYANFISTEHKLSLSVFENKNTLTKWLYDLHNSVSNKLGIYYDITFEQVCDKYNSYVANCDNKSQHSKSIPFINYYNKEAPFLPFEKAKKFTKYAKKRGLINFNVNNNKSNWNERNEKCWEIIKNMRLNSIRGFEIQCEEKCDKCEHCKYRGLPTKEELELMQLMCTTLTTKIIDNMINHKLKKIE